MNSWKLNANAGTYFKRAICKSLGIDHTDIYWAVKSISDDGTINTRDGKKYKLQLKELL